MTSIAAAQWEEARNLRLAARLSQVDPTAAGSGLAREGVLRRAVGLTLEASGCSAPMGSRCRVEVAGGRWVDAEVVGFAGDRTFLMPTAHLEGLLPNARVVPNRMQGEVAVGEGLLGRVIDSDGVPLDGRGPIRAESQVPPSDTAVLTASTSSSSSRSAAKASAIPAKPLVSAGSSRRPASDSRTLPFSRTNSGRPRRSSSWRT